MLLEQDNEIVQFRPMTHIAYLFMTTRHMFSWKNMTMPYRYNFIWKSQTYSYETRSSFLSEPSSWAHFTSESSAQASTYPHPLQHHFCGSRLKIISGCCHLHFLVRSFQNAPGNIFEQATLRTRSYGSFLH